MTPTQTQRVFVVDDSRANVGILNRILAEAGYAVDIAYDGDAALKMADTIEPDLILLDVQLPGKSGFEVCRLFKRRVHLQDVPIIMLTLMSRTEDKVEGFEAGCVDYITKPFQLEEVMARVNAQLSIRALQSELKARNRELEEALENVKTLKGLLPICASCKAVRDDNGYWNQVESYLSQHVDVQFTHGICPGCMNDLYKDVLNKPSTSS